MPPNQIVPESVREELRRMLQTLQLINHTTLADTPEGWMALNRISNAREALRDTLAFDE
jgi:hypothetical protein